MKERERETQTNRGKKLLTKIMQIRLRNKHTEIKRKIFNKNGHIFRSKNSVQNYIN